MRLILLLLLAVAAAGCDRQKAVPQQGEAASVPGVPQKGVDRSRKGTPFPDVALVDLDGGPADAEAFRGTATLVNLWATWCAPCVKELPTLDALAQSKPPGLRVVTVSQDTADQSKVEAFLAKLGLEEFGRYHDSKMALAGALGVEVMPTTILYDSDGRELWRYTGDLDWSGPEAARLLGEAR